MKNFFIFTIFITIISAETIQYQRGGTVNNIESTITMLEDKQIRIFEHLEKIDTLMGKYNSFSSSYIARIRDIIKQGASCIVDNQKYLLYKKEYGEDNDYTIMYKNFKEECEDMKASRLQALKILDSRFKDLKLKVQELKFQKKIDVDRATRIEQYLNSLISDKDTLLGWK